MIEFRDVSKYYLTQTSRKVVVDHLTLSLPAGAKVGLLGRNGAGKSTLVGMIAGTVKPNTGSIRREGEIRLSSRSSRDRCLPTSARLGPTAVPRSLTR